MIEEVKRFEGKLKLETDGVVRRINLPLKTLTHKGRIIMSEDKKAVTVRPEL
jgi:hypothetical protein